MSTDASPLDQALASARKLPQAQQQALADEIMERVHELSASALTDAQRDEIKRRLAAPAEYAAPAAIKGFFARHGVTE